MLIWTDDKYVSSSEVCAPVLNITFSYGNIRRFPLVSERNRTGGAGTLILPTEFPVLTTCQVCIITLTTWVLRGTTNGSQ